MIMSNNLLYYSCKGKRLEWRNFFSFRNVGALIDVVDIYREYNRGTYRNMQFQGFGFFPKCSRGSEMKPMAY